MPLETRDIIRRLNQQTKQAQKCSGVLALWIEWIEIGTIDPACVAVVQAPLAIEIRRLPAEADGGPDLAPSGLRPQYQDRHPPAVTAGLVAVQFHKPIFPFRDFPQRW